MRGSRATSLLTPRAVKVLIGLPLVLAGFALALQVRTYGTFASIAVPIATSRDLSGAF